MTNDKAFAAYALFLVTALLIVIGGLLASGIAQAPAPLVFAEHIALGLGMRAAYKSFGGWDWAEWSLTSDAPSDTDEGSALPAGGLGASA